MWPVLTNVPSGLALYRFSWTVPDSYLELQLMRDAAVEATRELAGAKLVLDLSPKTGRLHLYGLGLGTEDELHAATAKWRSITGAHHEACRTNPITGARGYFDEVESKGTCSSKVGERFETNLRRTVTYGLKPLPDGFRYSVAERVVVASGVFAPVWAEVVQRLGLHAPYRAPSRKKPALRATCAGCGKPLPAHRRRHKLYCNDACKQRARRIAYRRRYPRYRPRLVTDPALRTELIERLRVHERFLREGGGIDVLEQLGTAKSDAEAEAQLARLVAASILRFCMDDSGSGEVCYELVPTSDGKVNEDRDNSGVEVSEAATYTDPGTRIEGTGHPRPDWNRLMFGGDGVIPPYPGTVVCPESKAIVEPAYTHSPPQLSADADDRGVAWSLLLAFRGAFEVVFHYPPLNYFTDPAHLSRWRGFGSLSAAGRLLRERGIAPVVWVMWSLDAWNSYVAKGAPTLGWVFSMNRIEKHTADRAWFCSEASGYGASRAIFGPGLRALLHRYKRMRTELLVTKTEEEVREIVQKHFPGDAYNDMVQVARAETQGIEAGIREAISRGEYVWSPCWMPDSGGPPGGVHEAAERVRERPPERGAPRMAEQAAFAWGTVPLV